MTSKLSHHYTTQLHETVQKSPQMTAADTFKQIQRLLQEETAIIEEIEPVFNNYQVISGKIS